jgi:hypothetical protein
MSSVTIDSFSTAWQPDASGLWALSISAAAARFGGEGMEIVATAGAGPAPAPSARLTLPAAVDLREREELRLWLRSSRAGAYLELEVDSVPASGSAWRRQLPVRRAHHWELHRLWIGDMAAGVRSAARRLRLRSLDGTVAFTAAVDELLAVQPQAVVDADAALLARLHRRFSVPGAAGPTPVPAILDFPESPGTRVAPYILITPWSVQPEAPPAGERVDSPTMTGAATRPAPLFATLEYRIDVFATNRAEKSALLGEIVPALLRPLPVAGAAVTVDPFAGPAEPPGRTPLYVRMLVPVETGARTFRDLATARLQVGHIDDRPGAEPVPV